MADSRDIEFERILVEYAGRRQLDPGYTPDQVFALFVTDGIVSEFVVGPFEPDDIFVDGTDDTGLDALAIIIDNVLVESEADVARLLEGKRHAEVHFVLVQVTSKKAFEVRKFEKFENGAYAFFAEQSQPRAVRRMRRNADIKAAAAVRATVFRELRARGLPMPHVHLYYTSRGYWKAPPSLVGRRRTLLDRLDQLGLFRRVTLDWQDFASVLELRRRFRQRNAGSVRQFRLQPIPASKDVDAAYHGCILAEDLISLASVPGGGAINPDVFLENVRDHLADNDVNDQIGATIDAGDHQMFAMLSNGVTILCRHARADEDRLALYDYQIVNGCQTTHVIHGRAAKLAGKGMLVPAKIVMTRSPQVMRRVIEASNRQTAITPENLLSLLPFNRSLADYYEAMQASDGPVKLFYAIREGSLPADPAMPVIDVRRQIQAYVAMVLGSPHDVTNATREYVAMAGSRLFGGDDAVEPYYVAALALHRWTRFAETAAASGIATSRTPQEIRNARFQALYALGRVAYRGEFERLSRDAIFDRCGMLTALLMDDERVRPLFAAILDVLEAAVGPDAQWRANVLARQTTTVAIAEHVATHFDGRETLLAGTDEPSVFDAD